VTGTGSGDLSALAQRALGHARGAQALATVSRERSLTARIARSRPTQATSVDDVSVAISCVRDGRVATALTRGTGDEALRDAAVRSAAAAAAEARGGPGDYPGFPGPASPLPPRDGWDAETARLDPAMPAAALRAAFAVAAEHGLEAYGVWTAGEVRTAIASTTGVLAHEAVTDAHLKVICRDPSGSRSGAAAATSRAAGALDPDAVAREAARRAPPGERGVLEPGEYPVVLEADAVGVLLELLGLLAFNGLAHAEGRGALAGRLGMRVAAARINLADSPSYPTTLPHAFDAEGVPKRPVPLIQDGVAHRVVHDTRSAAIAGRGARSTGHAGAPGGTPVGPVPSNLVLVGGGARDVHELALPIERGIYVTRLWYVNAVHAKRTLLTGMTRDGTFLIEDGAISRPVRDVRFTDSALRILDATEALTASTRLVTEAEHYGRRHATGVVCPALRVRDLKVTGVAPP
jgi:predicted Zn-dependent protease